MITLFLYGIGAKLSFILAFSNVVLHYSYMELEQMCYLITSWVIFYYIIPIWNWSSTIWFTWSSFSVSLHYSYMELELLDKTKKYMIDGLHYSYMELELWIWSGYCIRINANYIIPIWNWSLNNSFTYILFILDYIIPIWNWSNNTIIRVIPLLFITLFLYGIGALLVLPS